MDSFNTNTVKMKKIGLRKVMHLLCFVFLCSVISNAQSKWSLEKCLDHARSHNLQIEGMKINLLQADLDRHQAAQSRYPNLSGFSNFSYNIGRNIDPTTNDFVPTNLGFNRISLSTDIPIYLGGRLKERYAQTKIRRSEWSARHQQMVQDISLEITTTFLNILFEMERKRNFEKQLETSESQLERVSKLIASDMSPEAEKYEWIAQIQGDKQMIRSSDNVIENNLFQLKNLLNIGADTDLGIEEPEALNLDVILTQTVDFNSVFEQAYANRPGIKAMQLNEDAGQKEINVMKSFYLPNISIGAGLSTNFSSLAKTFDNFSEQRISEEGIYINGEPVLFEIEESIPGESFRTPYLDQLNQNLGIGVGIQLNIPIYDRGNARSNVKRAEYALDQLKNENEQNINNFKLEVNQILADFKNAKAQYLAGETRVEFLQNSYDNVLKRYELGMSNNFELIDVQNRLNQAINDFTIAKYDLIFRNKIIDFYTGQKMKL